jgi:predicted glycoside hydrolase/deacetylase ChbG (UPF0249 family)
MHTFLFTADDYGKFADGDRIIRENGLSRLSVMTKRQRPFETAALEGKTVGLHADFGGEHLTDFLTRVFRPRYIARELQSQIDEFTRVFGKPPAYVDSHRFFHFFPTAFPVFLKVCKANNIPYLRIGRKGVVKINSIKTLVIHVMILMNYWLYRKQVEPFISVDYFLSLDWYDSLDFPMPDGVIKVIFHPENSEALLKQLREMQSQTPS